MIGRANVTHAHPVGEWPELIPTRDMGAFFNANTQNRRSHCEKCMCRTDACSIDLLQVKNQYKHHDNTEREVRQLSHHQEGRTDSPPIRSIFFVKKIVFFFFSKISKKKLGSAPKR